MRQLLISVHLTDRRAETWRASGEDIQTDVGMGHARSHDRLSSMMDRMGNGQVMTSTVPRARTTCGVVIAHRNVFGNKKAVSRGVSTELSIH